MSHITHLTVCPRVPVWTLALVSGAYRPALSAVLARSARTPTLLHLTVPTHEPWLAHARVAMTTILTGTHTNWSWKTPCSNAGLASKRFHMSAQIHWLRHCWQHEDTKQTAADQWTYTSVSKPHFNPEKDTPPISHNSVVKSFKLVVWNASFQRVGIAPDVKAS